MPNVTDLPEAKNIPLLTINVEGLKRHSLFMRFIPEQNLSPDEQKLRSWLLHIVTTAGRHYTKARKLVESQNSADQLKDGGVIFYILDVYEQIEGAVMSANRACMAIRRLRESHPGAEEFVAVHDTSLKSLSDIRNQYEHMHQQITTNQAGKGPISMSFADEGRKIKFRNLSLETTTLHGLIESAYKFVAKMFPSFNADSVPEVAGHTKLTISASITVTESVTKQ